MWNIVVDAIEQNNCRCRGRRASATCHHRTHKGHSRHKLIDACPWSNAGQHDDHPGSAVGRLGNFLPVCTKSQSRIMTGLEASSPLSQEPCFRHIPRPLTCDVLRLEAIAAMTFSDQHLQVVPCE